MDVPASELSVAASELSVAASELSVALPDTVDGNRSSNYHLFNFQSLPLKYEGTGEQTK
jgi:hypothetical protein